LEPGLFTEELPLLWRSHLLRRAHQQWGGLTPIRLQWDQFQREATHQCLITVDGFSIQSSQFASAAVLVVLRAFMRGTPGSFGLVFQLGSSCYCIRFIYILYLLYSTISFPNMQTYIPNWFSLGRVYPGSC
jgi:hypothetical protein